MCSFNELCIVFHESYKESLSNSLEIKVWKTLAGINLKPSNPCIMFLGLTFKDDSGFLYAYSLKREVVVPFAADSSMFWASLALSIYEEKKKVLWEIMKMFNEKTSLPGYPGKYNFVEVEGYQVYPPYQNVNYIEPITDVADVAGTMAQERARAELLKNRNRILNRCKEIVMNEEEPAEEEPIEPLDDLREPRNKQQRIIYNNRLTINKLTEAVNKLRRKDEMERT